VGFSLRLERPALARHEFKRVSQLALAAGVVAIWTWDGEAAEKVGRIPIPRAPKVSEMARRRLAGDLRAIRASALKTCSEVPVTLGTTTRGRTILPRGRHAPINRGGDQQSLIGR
jgi:hypothetical protein